MKKFMCTANINSLVYAIIEYAKDRPANTGYAKIISSVKSILAQFLCFFIMRTAQLYAPPDISQKCKETLKRERPDDICNE